jgi:hypothetical protein
LVNGIELFELLGMFPGQIVQLGPVCFQVAKLPDLAVNGDKFPLALSDGPIALMLP